MRSGWVQDKRVKGVRKYENPDGIQPVSCKGSYLMGQLYFFLLLSSIILTGRGH